MTAVSFRVRRLLFVSTALFVAIAVAALVWLEPGRAIVPLVAAIAGVVVNVAAARGLRGEDEPPADAAGTVVAPEPEAPKPARVEVVTAAVVRLSGAAPDLVPILSGIIADEEGTASLGEDGSIASLFRGRRHAAHAVHAAQRIVSNVDALRAHLDRDLRIAIGLADGTPDDARARAASLASAASERNLALLATAEGSGLVRYEVEEEELFTFAPVQTRLPGF